MEGALANYADGVAQALVGKLGLLMTEEYRLLRIVRGEVVHLRDDVAIMNALLRMHSEADDGAVDHFVREWMKQVRELASDGEDCIDLFVRRISFVPQGPRALRGAWHLIVTLLARHRLAADIQDLRARALAIGERRVRYGVDGQALRRSAYFIPAAVASSSAQALGTANDPNQLVGIGKQVESLSEKVKKVNPADNKLTVFSIVGFGGLGKTMLAVEVCRKLQEEFDCQATVSVSQEFDAGKDLSGLMQRILRQVVKVKTDDKQKGILKEDPLGAIDDNVDNLEGKLKDHLKDKRYLVVIDDVWSISAWDAIRFRLPENNKSSRIIVTTRIETVAKSCSPGSAHEDYIYRIEPLKSKHSRILFVNRVFGPGNACPKELEDAMDKILKKCGGLPLAIVSTASIMASYKSPGSLEMWTRVCNSIGSLGA